ncbi:MAG: type II toxin-antitoxin system RelE/ParE family toxin [Candidatus Nomurabacteria bacterium]|jgi:plasmid stabilization system protein ParE|nr:type II toxin-antitoxin system RelE/ParE family toxin [Candidatus Nomurabacteria bacterium]
MPKYRVVFTTNAENDLKRIAKYLYDNDFDREIVYKIRRESEKVLLKRAIGGILYDENRGIRKILIMRKNSVYYNIDGNKVNILHIRAGGMSEKIKM